MAALAEELRDEQQRLEILATDDAHVSVVAALSLSFQALPEPAARLFTLLGLHPGQDVDVYAAAALAGITTAAARRALASLDSCHLAYQPAPGRYASHDLIRLYARSLAAARPAEEQRDVLVRLLDYFLAATTNATRNVLSHSKPTVHLPMEHPPKATPVFADSADAYSWFDAEEKNIRALVTGTGLHEHAWRLAHNSFIMYDTGSRNADMEACMADGVRAARAAGSKQGTAYLLTCLSPCLSDRGRHDEALDCLREAAKLIGDAPDHFMRYRLMSRLAQVDMAAGQQEQAREHLDEALAAAGKLGRNYEASVLNVIAWNYLEQSAPARALTYSQLAVDLKASLAGQDVLLAAYLHTHSSALEQLGRLGEAFSCYRQALDIAEACGSKYIAVLCYHGLGTTLARLGQTSEAEQNLRVAVDLYGIHGQTAEAAQAREQLEELLVSGDGVLGSKLLATRWNR